MTPRIKTRIKIWAVVVGVFFLGCVTGASLDSLYRLKTRGANSQWGPGRRGNDEALGRMKRELNLNEQQTTEIKAILDQTGNDYRALRTEVRPRYDAIRQNARTRIRAVLTPEQQKLFDAKTAERDARRDGNGKDDR
jgi:Spy/CpxP family protein refolding chaperone